MIAEASRQSHGDVNADGRHSWRTIGLIPKAPWRLGGFRVALGIGGMDAAGLGNPMAVDHDPGRVHRAFYALSRQTGLREVGARTGPRLHDLRHRMAVVTLTRWYASGEEPERRMPVLSTYLGHVCVAGSYWYLSGEPALMAQALARLERRWEVAP